MSEQDPATRPTLETLLEMLRETRDEARSFRAEVGRRFDALDVRLDRIESEVKQTHSEFYALRADFGEPRGQLKDLNLVK